LASKREIDSWINQVNEGKYSYGSNSAKKRELDSPLNKRPGPNSTKKSDNDKHLNGPNSTKKSDYEKYLNERHGPNSTKKSDNEKQLYERHDGPNSIKKSDNDKYLNERQEFNVRTPVKKNREETGLSNSSRKRFVLSKLDK
jgi:hypothetical protein